MCQCGTCGDDFNSRSDCDDHMDTFDHWVECETCTRQFRTQRSCNQHMDALNHREFVFGCQTCNCIFPSRAAADQHMKHKRHYKYYCSQCERRFLSDNRLRQHLKSKFHVGTDVSCPFCNAPFVTASGVTSHLEYGTCPKADNWNRETIRQMIQGIDPTGLVTNQQIGGHNDESERYYATESALDGTTWVCYICQRRFITRAALNTHVNSSIHKQKIYHCPNTRCCDKEFALLSALFIHLEHETCGYARFENVPNVYRQLLDAILNDKVVTGL
ncbi:uncharacterized protein N7479_011393 [Penicillium vulpinum]|uniref:C2H2-type domain-containing protein n=1 Tax=Penicillium vulpinum TaxID=29845 RepID=A0A1V6RXS7_9EURO|nr:uncharacterized protein N7479_011393 [Penicillium vulpinum]KAJ5952980.1 hypothetical protein N7479_011393 [Penicillium vulpinum]OQE06446.1 hypothetical protein PENVUL_c018G09016 [Penicillium vulpinum]